MFAMRRLMGVKLFTTQKSFRLCRNLVVPASQVVKFDFKTISELQVKATAAYANSPMFGTQTNGKFTWVSYSEFDRMVQKCRSFLNALGLKADDKVAIISNNRLEWAVLQYATIGLGAQIVPMYEAQPEKDWQYILKDSDASVLVVATEAIYEKVKDYVGMIGQVNHVLCFDSPEDLPHSFKFSLTRGETLPVIPALVDLDEDHICAIIYTSGTTGNPKGVELSHKNFVSNIKGATAAWEHSEGPMQPEVTLSFLPWAHSFGMTLELHHMTAIGSARAIVPKKEMLLECLAAARPTLIFSVPMLFNKVYDGVMKNLSEQSPLKQKIVKHALKVARARNEALEFDRPVPFFTNLQHKIFDKIVLSKIRARLGGRLRYMAAGGAATSTPVLQFFEDIGVPIMEGYGLTETAPMATVSTPKWSQRRLGCAGVVLPGGHIRIVDPDDVSKELPADTVGEVTYAGPNVMARYRNNPAANEEVFYQHDGKRFFRTGDMGRMVEGKFLKITGRLKEQFKLENGKFVVPAPLEDAFARSPYIAQMYIGEANHPSTVALVVPNYQNLLALSQSNHNKGITPALLPSAELINRPLEETITVTVPLFENPAFIQLINNEIERIGAQLKHYEQPTHWLPVLQPFSPENQLMTPKLSLRRVHVGKAYHAQIAQLCGGKGIAVKWVRHRW